MKWALFTVLGLASAVSEARVACFNRLYTNTAPLDLELSLPKTVASFKESSCRLKRIKYNPISEKYKGWIRVGTPKDNCADLGLALFGLSDVSKKPTRVYWISISPEVRQGVKGFIQIGYENDIDPATGPESKLNMVCFPDP
ncbi:MAG: hypothetical protein KF799_12245 [Bdellovibrionales bacterium]|nr:hypothetical protein [Bdellovibrionales bacterium]